MMDSPWPVVYNVHFQQSSIQLSVGEWRQQADSHKPKRSQANRNRDQVTNGPYPCVTLRQAWLLNLPFIPGGDTNGGASKFLQNISQSFRGVLSLNATISLASVRLKLWLSHDGRRGHRKKSELGRTEQEPDCGIWGYAAQEVKEGQKELQTCCISTSME